MSRRAEPRRRLALRSRRSARVTAFVLVLLPVCPALAQDPSLLQDEVSLAGRETPLGAGARAFGMAGAFLARADDATAASWNPAGLSYLRVAELSVVGNYNAFDSSFGDDIDELRGGALDFASFAWPIRIRGASGSVQVNYQRAVPWNGDRYIEEGHEQGTRVFTGDQSGGFDVIAFGTGLSLTRTLRLGATLNRWFNGYSVTQDKSFPGTIRQRRILGQEFDLRGWNTNLGFIYSPVEQVNIAGVFKTSFTGKVRLKKTRTDYYFLPSSGAIENITMNAAQRDDVRVDFPWSLGFGVSWRLRNALTFSADYTETNWSEGRIRNYFAVLPTPQPGDEPESPPDPIVFESPLPYPYVFLESQNDTEEIRAGVEYVLIRGRVKVPLRAGYFNAQRISPFSVSDPPRFNGFALGTGILLGPVILDLAYLYERGEIAVTLETPPAEDGVTSPATGQEPVRNTVRNQRFFASLIYRFGRP